jgi:hypothetical protein
MIYTIGMKGIGGNQMPKVERIRRLINFNKEVYEKLEEIAEKSGGGIGYLVNLACSFWIDTHEGMKELPRVLAEMSKFNELAEKYGFEKARESMKTIKSSEVDSGGETG